MMGYVASPLRMPISRHQCRSSLFLNVSIDGASTTSCGSLFHSLTIRKLKKFCLAVVWHLGLNNFNECPLSPLVTSPVQRTCCSWHVLFQSVSWTFLSNLNGRPNPNPAHEGPKRTLKSIWYRIVSYRRPDDDRERKCADATGTVPVPWAGRFQC